MTRNTVLTPHEGSNTLGSTVLSVVVPAYKEAGNVEQLYQQLLQALSPLGWPWELIVVDDGSPDGTWEHIVELHDRDPRVKGLRLSRNFGKPYALLAGMSEATGDAVVTLDSDLQHPPSVIPLLIAEWRKGSKIVHGVRKNPPGQSWTQQVTSKMFYPVFSFLSGVPLSRGTGDFRLLDRQVVDEILKLKEMGLFLPGLVKWVGYPNAQVEYRCGDRFAGDSSYGFRRRLRLAWTGITSFSIVPLRFAIVLGLITSTFAFYSLLEALYTKLFTKNDLLPGWASIYGIISLLFGILFILIGIIGEYIARILEEVRGRPRYIISERAVREVEAPPEQDRVTSGGATRAGGTTPK